MLIEDQQEVVAFLCRPGTLGDGPLERIETHISKIFLIGARAYKLKRSVRFAYLDFSTQDKRRQACEAEVAINRLTAPSLYRGVVAVRRAADGTLQLDGDGEPVDWLVEMTRFDQGALFDRMARAGLLDRRTMEGLAGIIARFHDGAAAASGYGGRHGMAAIIDGSAQTFAEVGPGILDKDKIALLDAETRRVLDRGAALLDQRLDGGLVRRCHGDLHLRNILLLDGRPTLFDAIEFNPALSHIDVLYDLAFLLMDLDHRHLRSLANRVLNHYLDARGDDGGLALLPLFLSVRAAIRAHVAAAAAKSNGAAEAEAEADDSRAYLDQAIDYLAPAVPKLVAVGGLSGAGKSRLAASLAPSLGAAPGARVVRSDVIRKRLAGVDPLSRLGAEGYTAEKTAATYRSVIDTTRTILSAGHAVIADAVFARPDERGAIADVAALAGVPFQGLWLEAPLDVMRERIVGRRGDASDADADVVQRQSAYNIGTIEWERIDSSGAREETVARCRALVG